MKKTNSKKGFTLVEIMVVMGIVGILATVVLLVLKNARARGSDTAIEATMEGVRKLAVLEFINLGGKYTTLNTPITGADCGTLSTAGTIFANSGIRAALADVKNKNGGIALSCNVSTNGESYAISTTLKTAGKYWCIDSTGVAKGTQGTGDTDYTAQIGPNATSAIWQGLYACN